MPSLPLRPFALVPALLVLAAPLAGCSSDDPASETSAAATTSAASTTGASTSSGAGGAGGDATTGAGGSGGSGGVVDGPIGGDRPVDVFVPSTYSDATATPLVILLHGYGASGVIQESYFQLQALAEERGFLYAHPDGTEDGGGSQFWNATDACCNFYGSAVDDSAYLASVVQGIQGKYNVDPKRVYFVGHSNGGFMSYRMACDHAGTVAAIVSLAGAMYDDASKCAASEPVAVLQVHGTADETIDYNGGPLFTATMPSAQTSVTDWATIGDCDTTPDTTPPPLDLDASLAGDETTVERYAAGCKPGGHAELWTIQGGSHIPSLSADFAPAIIDFLLAHPKP